MVPHRQLKALAGVAMLPPSMRVREHETDSDDVDDEDWQLHEHEEAGDDTCRSGSHDERNQEDSKGREPANLSEDMKDGDPASANRRGSMSPEQAHDG